jgi:hypothetical protein
VTCDSPAWTGPAQPVWLSCVKCAGVTVSSALLVVLAARLLQALGAGGAPWILLAPSALAGYLCADLLSGTAHWFCDTFFDERTPVIGGAVILPFRDHHVHPGRITQYRFIEQDTTNFFIMIPLLAGALRLGGPESGHPGSLAAGSFLCALAVGSYGTNLFHKWAHASVVPPGVRWLQRHGLILTPAHHRAHHRDHSKAFCVTSGWMNPLLDALGFFPTLEDVFKGSRRRHVA